MTDILDIARTAGIVTEEIPRKEAWALLQGWREVYCAPVHIATGSWVIGGAGGYSWHTFSHEYFPCLKGCRALAEYDRQQSSEFLVLPERSNDPALRCSGPALPDFSGLYRDLYVAPASFEWTMVFTHERELFGPYFSRAGWLGDSNSRN
ncbi:MAG: hypothetical protein Tsb0032_37590 [Kiloniellaceae bacterium]